MKSYCSRCIHFKKTKEKLIKIKYIIDTRNNYWEVFQGETLRSPDDYVKNYVGKICMCPECFKYSRRDGLADKKYRKTAKMKRVISHIQLNDTNYCLYYSPKVFWWIVQKIFYFFR